MSDTPTVLSEEELASCIAVHDAAEKERLEDYEIYGDPRHQTVEAGAHYHRGRLLATIQAERALKEHFIADWSKAENDAIAATHRAEAAEKENADLKAMVGRLVSTGTHFKAFAKGEYGCPSGSDEDDHNVYDFDDALASASAYLDGAPKVG